MSYSVRIMYVGSELMSALKFACWVERGGLNPRESQCGLCGPGLLGVVGGMSSLAPRTFAERPLGARAQLVKKHAETGTTGPENRPEANP